MPWRVMHACHAVMHVLPGPSTIFHQRKPALEKQLRPASWLSQRQLQAAGATLHAQKYAETIDLI